MRREKGKGREGKRKGWVIILLGTYLPAYLSIPVNREFPNDLEAC